MLALIGTAFFSQNSLQFALIGMATGSLVALVALGIVLAYRASGVLNFSTSAMGGVAAYFFYTMRDQHHWYWIAALIPALVIGALLGALTQFLVMNVLRRASLVTKLIATLGLMTTAQGAVLIIWGTKSKGIPKSILPTTLVKLTDQMVIPKERLIIIAVAIVLAVVLRLLYTKTLFGLATASVAENRRVAGASGWSPSRIELINFILGGTMSAVAAILLVPIVGLNIGSLSLLVLPALASALAGRFSSFSITLGAALAIGIVSSELGLFRIDIASALNVQTESLSGLPDVVPLLIILVVVILSGKARLQRGETMARLPLPGSGRIRPGLLAFGVAVGLVLLFALDAPWADALTVSFAAGILALSVVVVTGYCGQLSLAQFALAGFGAWAAARMVAVAHLPFELAILVGMVATIPVGLIVALPALRTRGVNLAVATLALALMITAVIFSNGSLTGGFAGTVVKPPTLFGIEIDAVRHPERYGLFALVLFVIVGLLIANLRRGRTGRRLLAVRANERAAASLGIGVYSTKLYAFAVGSATAALAGVILGFRNANVQFGQFDVLGSINAVLNTVLGGLGMASGALVAGIQSAGGLNTKILTTIIDTPKITFWLLVVSGIGVVAVLRQSPDGLAALWSHKVGSKIRGIKIIRREQPPLPPTPRRGRQPVTLAVSGISVQFGGVRALDDVSFTALPGEVFGLIGPNGAGKTTMLDVMTGFTKPVAGHVLLDGRPIDDLTPEKRARIGMARSWQAVELFEEMTVRDNLMVAADRHTPARYLLDLVRPGRQRTSEAMEAVIAEFKLESYLDVRPSELSQGLARLVGIARAMVTEPSVLLLDEPAAGLSQQEGAELGAAVRRVAKTQGIPVIIIEHDVALMVDICDRMTVLDFGRKISEGTPAEVMADSDVIHAYLGDKIEPAKDGARAGATSAGRPAAGDVVLSARGLDAGYGELTIVHDLDLEIRAGEVVTLLGPNGAGKTTTLMTLAGDLPALRGDVILHGSAVTALPLHQRVQRGLGLVAEQRTVLMTLTIEENLKVNRGDSEYALSLFPELVPHLKRRVGMLSGGQQQMLSLARALSRRPTVLLADELSLGLGPIVVSRLLQALRAAADTGVGVLLVEQHVHQALAIADRAYVLRRGVVQLSGTSAEVSARIDEVQDSYLSTDVSETSHV
jgi:ABC-type branched-subunit amino acid transport system ATPase component/ABC-type branched-subunit amino acid transport system permease subunit